jgi:excisionase family DNA binding protein
MGDVTAINQSEQPEQLLSTEELARYLKVHRVTISRMVQEGMPAMKVGIGAKMWRFSLPEVVRWMKERGEKSA